jgi:hypothetical protein
MGVVYIDMVRVNEHLDFSLSEFRNVLLPTAAYQKCIDLQQQKVHSRVYMQKRMTALPQTKLREDIPNCWDFGAHLKHSSRAMSKCAFHKLHVCINSTALLKKRLLRRTPWVHTSKPTLNEVIQIHFTAKMTFAAGRKLVKVGRRCLPLATFYLKGSPTSEWSMCQDTFEEQEIEQSKSFYLCSNCLFGSILLGVEPNV